MLTPDLVVITRVVGILSPYAAREASARLPDAASCKALVHEAVAANTR